MFYKRHFSLLLIFSFLSLLNCSIKRFDIYLESECPFCQKFIVQSFKKLYDNPDREKMATVVFHPYGNAQTYKNGSYWNFTCQHGPSECYGNTIQTCGLNILSKDNGYRMMLCMFDNLYIFNKDFDKIPDFCIKDDAWYSDIMNCAHNKTGNDLQYAVAATHPSFVKSVPYFMIDGQNLPSQVHSSIFNDINGYLCSLEENKNLGGCLRK